MPCHTSISAKILPGQGCESAAPTYGNGH
jgi:hypothetical protein